MPRSRKTKLVRTKEKLQQRLHDIDAKLAVLAHELRIKPARLQILADELRKSEAWKAQNTPE